MRWVLETLKLVATALVLLLIIAVALFAMAAFFFSFGLFAKLRPAALRHAMDNFANAWKEEGYHPYRMPLSLLRVVAGGLGLLGAALFVYFAFAMLRR